MRFFKYLIFVLLSFLSVTVFAQRVYFAYGQQGVQEYDSARSFCLSRLQPQNNYISYDESTNPGTCRYQDKVSKEDRYVNFYYAGEPKCPHPDTVTAVANVGAKLEAVRCVPLAGTGRFCVYKKSPNTLIINVPSSSNPEKGALAYDMVSVSKTPVDNCTPLFEGQCDPKDPYGGCFKVPDDGCTRTQNGSIVCPNNSVPPVEQTCTGTYCKRPPSGCPSGYVSGSFNGEALCVKSSPSSGGGSGDGSGSGNGDGSGTGSGTGSGNGDGSGTGSGTGSGSNSSTSFSTSTSTSTSTSSNGSGGSTTVNVTNNNTVQTTVYVDVQGVVNAINTMRNSVNEFLNDVNNSVKEVTSTLNNTNQKIDTTNQKLDTTNNTLSHINQNGKDTNNKLDQLINKQGGENNGNGTDLTATNQKIDELNKTAKESKGLIQDIKDWLTTPPDQAQLDGLNGELPQKEIPRSELKTNIFASSAQCPPDSTLVMPMLGTYTFSFSEWCYYLQIAGYFILIGAYLFAAYIVSKA
ncbi:virulence factor TspB C-terminal domain-related protein [Acinetobacter ursingii]|uniref:virulence factor TspB C-terminal domain-related protein n=1 Tax=Acinetobacter ursingii TaxID=108980 RepID=UPI0021CDC01C|nr:virulence factor TspB C-terminal domain-related protein [Acinetobacter ursingii]MCU4351002.1 hypothetical protein [Acinetobacter ursingii]